jgi:ParB-like chromosome segregation protein Spo0J
MGLISNLVVERVPLDSIHPHPDNARRGDLDVIADSLQVHGQFSPLIVQRSTGNIVKGNHTWLAAQMLGFELVDVAFIDVDDDQALRILLVDNRAADLGGYEEQSLTDLLASLNDLVGTGYDPGDLDARLASLAAPPDAGWEDRDTKAVLLAYPADEHAVVVANLDAVAARLGAVSHAEVVAALVAEQVAE